jgi:hypothetical protein
MTPDDPRHGQRAGYIAGCRSVCCQQPNQRWIKRYRLAASRNGGRTTVDSAPVIAHLRTLRQTMSLGAIAAAGNSSTSHLSRLLRGDHPTLRVATATALLSVRADQPVDKHFVSALGARRRLQALAAIGYTFERLAPIVDYTRYNVRILANGDRDWISSAVDQRIRTAYNRLHMQPPVPANHHEQAGITKVKARAIAKGWAPAFAWDAETIDDPNTQPVVAPALAPDAADYIDHAAVLARIEGDRDVELNRAEQLELVHRMTAAEWGQKQIEARTGINAARVLREERARLGATRQDDEAAA